MDNWREIIEQLVEDYGLERLMEQNDLEELDVVIALYRVGLLDLDDYIFTELDVSDED